MTTVDFITEPFYCVDHDKRDLALRGRVIQFRMMVVRAFQLLIGLDRFPMLHLQPELVNVQFPQKNFQLLFRLFYFCSEKRPPHNSCRLKRPQCLAGASFTGLPNPIIRAYTRILPF
jgi:hypothetical protein